MVQSDYDRSVGKGTPARGEVRGSLREGASTVPSTEEAWDEYLVNERINPCLGMSTQATEDG